MVNEWGTGEHRPRAAGLNGRDTAWTVLTAKRREANTGRNRGSIKSSLAAVGHLHGRIVLQGQGTG